jgi:hypothetical protein
VTSGVTPAVGLWDPTNKSFSLRFYSATRVLGQLNKAHAEMAKVKPMESRRRNERP